VKNAVRVSVRGGEGGEDHSDTSTDCASRVLAVLGSCQRPEEAFREAAAVVLPVGSLRHDICSKYSSSLQLPPEPSPSAAEGEPAPAAEQMCYKTRAKVFA